MGLGRGFIYASRGLKMVLKQEKNARIHLAVAILAVILAKLLNFTSNQFVLLFLTIGLVVCAEVFNTVIEKTLDFIDDTDNHRIAAIKDMAAGGVLLAALFAIIIGLFLFGVPLWKILWGN